MKLWVKIQGVQKWFTYFFVLKKIYSNEREGLCAYLNMYNNEKIKHKYKMHKESKLTGLTGVIWQVTDDHWSLTSDNWDITFDRWHLTGFRWHLTDDSWNSIDGTWHLTVWHITFDRCKMTFDKWYLSFSKVKVVCKPIQKDWSSYLGWFLIHHYIWTRWHRLSPFGLQVSEYTYTQYFYTLWMCSTNLFSLISFNMLSCSILLVEDWLFFLFLFFSSTALMF